MHSYETTFLSFHFSVTILTHPASPEPLPFPGLLVKKPRLFTFLSLLHTSWIFPPLGPSSRKTLARRWEVGIPYLLARGPSDQTEGLPSQRLCCLLATSVLSPEMSGSSISVFLQIPVFFPNLPATITFLSPQTAAPCILSRVLTTG